MAGISSFRDQKSGRKKWNVFVNSYSKRHLKIESNYSSYLDDNDDCNPENQLMLAKELLDDSCCSGTEMDTTENQREGVSWLIKASEQGNREATDVLKKCLDSGIGICEQNFLEVKKCLLMSETEKFIIRAAKGYFYRTAEGEEFITSNQLKSALERTNQFANGNVPNAGDDAPTQKDLNPEGASHNPTDYSSRMSIIEAKISEDALISAARSYSNGRLPDEDRALALRQEQPQYSWLRFASRCFYEDILDTLRFFPLLISAQNVRWLTIIAFLMIFKLETAAEATPSIVYYSSMLIMAGATCKIISQKQDFRVFRRWSNLFIAYGSKEMSADDAEYLYYCNFLKPYVWFSVAMLFHLGAMSLNVVSDYFHSEMTVAAFSLAITTLYVFSMSGPRYGSDSNVDAWALLSFSFYVLAKYPYETDQVVSQKWRFLDLHFPTFVTHLVGTGVEFCFDYRVIFYLIVPGILLKMCSRNRWRGIFTDFLPHCLVLSWFQLALIFSNGATQFGLVRSVLALVGLIFFPLLSVAATFILPIVASWKYLTTNENAIPLIAFVFMSVILPCIMWVRNRSRKNSVVTTIQVALSVASGVFLFNHYAHFEADNSVGLNWSQFSSVCGAPHVHPDSIISAQLECSQLIGARVDWEGRVSKTYVAEIYNPIAVITEYLPTTLSKYVRCFFGDKIAESCEIDNDYCDVLSMAHGQCTISKWNRYKFAVEVAIEQNSWVSHATVVTLFAEGSFRNFTSSLLPKDQIWFYGYLVGDSLGKKPLSPTSPAVILTDIGCVSCADDTLTKHSRNQGVVFSTEDLFSLLKTLLHFMFYPVVIFK